jgi:hypothetical protein
MELKIEVNKKYLNLQYGQRLLEESYKKNANNINKGLEGLSPKYCLIKGIRQKGELP